MLGFITVIFALCCFLPAAYFIDQFNLRMKIKKVQDKYPNTELVKNMKLKEFNKRYHEFIILCCCYVQDENVNDCSNELNQN